MFNTLLFFSLNLEVCLVLLNAQKIPESVTSIAAAQMTPTVTYLRWRKPQNNFTLSYYDIQYSEITDTYLDAEEYLVTVDQNFEHSKLPDLNTDKRYKIYIYSIYQEVVSHPATIDVTLTSIGKYLPSKPEYRYELKNDGKEIRITWLPNIKYPGDRFFVRYRKKGDSSFVNSETEHENLNITVRNLERNQLYEFYVAACYGNQMAISEIKEIRT